MQVSIRYPSFIMRYISFQNIHTPFELILIHSVFYLLLKPKFCFKPDKPKPECTTLIFDSLNINIILLMSHELEIKHIFLFSNYSELE